MDIKKIIVLTFSTIFASQSFSQTPQELASAYAEKRAPVTPEAYQFLKFSDYPVDYNTGLPQINIPIYEVKSGKLNLPISISYHSSGIKPSEQAGIIGLGWGLNANGRVTRIKMGKEDDLYCFLGKRNASTLGPATTLEAYNYLSQMDRGGGDGEYDVFTYQANGLSGRFLLKDVNDGGSSPKVPIPFQCEPVKISLNPFTIQRIIIDENGTTYSGVTSGGIKYINILDDAGVLYRFGKSLSNDIDYVDITKNIVRDGVTEYPYVSSWLLTEIISADKSDTISFSYNVQHVSSPMSQSSTLTEYSNHSCGDLICSCGELSNTSPFGGTGVSSTQDQSLLTQIKFKEGVLNFNYTHVGGPAYSDQLQHITLLNTQNELIRKFSFTRVIPPNEYADRSQLVSLISYDGSNNVGESYKFFYNAGIGGGGSTSIDFWGYYNGATNSSNLFSSTWNYTIWPSMVQYPMGTANRQPNEQNMKVFQLNRIEYPTGGYSDFVFESNKVNYPGAGIKLVGGLRIKQIITNDGKGLISTKTYKYGINESGVGQLLMDGYNQSNFTRQLRTYYKHCDPYYSGYSYQNRKITTTSFSDGSGMLSTVPMVYPEVTEYIGNDVVNTGKTVYKYSPIGSSDFYTGNVYGSVASLANYLKYVGNWGRSRLLEKNIYKNGNGTYELLNQEKYFYTNFYKETLKGLVVNKDISHDLNGQDIGPPGDASSLSWLLKYSGVPYSYADASFFTIASKLSKKISYSFSNNIVLIDEIEYGYDNLTHLYPTQTLTTDSKGQVKKIENKYAHDLQIANPPNVYYEMVDRNVIAPIVEQTNKNITLNQELFRLKSNYQSWNGGVLLAPANVQKSISGGALESEVILNNYDNGGHLLQYTNKDGISHNYYWGNNKTYPIASIINAEIKNIFYTSFEEDGNSNTGDSKTGKKSKTDGFSQSLSNLTSGNYILSYWKKSGVNWILQKSTVPVSGTIYNININVTDQVDEIRFYPEKAMMTTYTYEPLIGMTSQCDANNRITYYEYDGFGRLKLIKDNDGNILKTFNYHYQTN